MGRGHGHGISVPVRLLSGLPPEFSVRAGARLSAAGVLRFSDHSENRAGRSVFRMVSAAGIPAQRLDAALFQPPVCAVRLYGRILLEYHVAGRAGAVPSAGGRHRLSAARRKIPPLYRRAGAQPVVQLLSELLLLHFRGAGLLRLLHLPSQRLSRLSAASGPDCPVYAAGDRSHGRPAAANAVRSSEHLFRLQRAAEAPCSEHRGKRLRRGW